MSCWSLNITNSPGNSPKPISGTRPQIQDLEIVYTLKSVIISLFGEILLFYTFNIPSFEKAHHRDVTTNLCNVHIDF